MRLKSKNSKKPRGKIIALYREYPGDEYPEVYRTGEEKQLYERFVEVVDNEGLLAINRHFKFRGNKLPAGFDRAII